MKPINLTQETEIELMKKCLQKIHEGIEKYKFDMNETKFSFSMDMCEEAKEKITILYSQDAYLKMNFLVDHYSTEVGWYGLVEKLSDKLYRVYDVKLCKQYVNGGKVDTEDEDTLEFFDSLTDDEIEHMHFQAHSHVNFSTVASGVDLANQHDVLKNMGKSGFYIFQIWNKKGDINTYLYDVDANTFYDKKDVVLEVETGDKTLTQWVAETEDLVQTKKIVQYYPEKYYPKQEKKKKKDEENVYLPGYWNGINYDDKEWDW